jgi:Arc/MetJ-type ribon-helix-helix transcriptional regulator
MVMSMAMTQKVTVTLPLDQIAAVRALVAEGQVESISGFVTSAVSLALDDRLAFEDLVEAGLQKTGGPMTDAERQWADDILRGTTGRS